MAESVRHRWDLSPADARELQRELASQVITSTPLPAWNFLATADVSFDRGAAEIHAAVLLYEKGNPEPIERIGVTGVASFPYVPGLLTFREGPVVLEAFELLKQRPDILLVDGQGIAHPLRLGIASHLGLWLNLPSIGCAKSLLCGRYDEPGPERGDRSPLTHHGQVIGTVLRTKRNVSPLFVSPGHLCRMEDAVELVLSLCTRYRLPDPSRAAHNFVNEVRRSWRTAQS